MGSLNKRSLAVIDTLLPDGAHPHLPGALAAGFEDFYDEEFAKTAGFPMRAGFRAALAFAVWTAPVLIGKMPPITRLSPSDREEAIRAMEKSRFYHVRQLLLILKAIVSFSYGAAPEVRRAVDFPDPALGFKKGEPS